MNLTFLRDILWRSLDFHDHIFFDVGEPNDLIMEIQNNLYKHYFRYSENTYYMNMEGLE